jgi:hypothetical protein
MKFPGQHTCLMGFAKLTIIGGLLMMVACAKPTEDRDFEIENNCSTDVQVEFYSFDTGDTSIVQVSPGQFQSIWTLPSASVTHNWYYDYGISINYITNANGDTAQFNANEAIRWHDIDKGYALWIHDELF